MNWSVKRTALSTQNQDAAVLENTLHESQPDITRSHTKYTTQQPSVASFLLEKRSDWAEVRSSKGAAKG
jgi:hypothetical protein